MHRTLILALAVVSLSLTMTSCGGDTRKEENSNSTSASMQSDSSTQVSSVAFFNELVFPLNYGWERLGKNDMEQAALGSLQKSLEDMNASSSESELQVADGTRFKLTLDAGEGCELHWGSYHQCSTFFTLRTTVIAYLGDEEVARESLDLDLHGSELSEIKERLRGATRVLLARLLAAKPQQ